MDPLSVHVVIVNWNSGRLLSQCLSSFSAVAADRIAVARITVVDNASTDGSCDALPEVAPPLDLIRNQDNRGFAAACNQGAAGSGADLLLFLNPDTRLLSGALERPALYLQSPSNGAVGIVGIQLIDADGRVARSCAQMPTRAPPPRPSTGARITSAAAAFCSRSSTSREQAPFWCWPRRC